MRKKIFLINLILSNVESFGSSNFTFNSDSRPWDPFSTEAVPANSHGQAPAAAVPGSNPNAKSFVPPAAAPANAWQKAPMNIQVGTANSHGQAPAAVAPGSNPNAKSFVPPAAAPANAWQKAPMNIQVGTASSHGQAPAAVAPGSNPNAKSFVPPAAAPANALQKAPMNIQVGTANSHRQAPAAVPAKAHGQVPGNPWGEASMNIQVGTANSHRQAPAAVPAKAHGQVPGNPWGEASMNIQVGTANSHRQAPAASPANAWQKPPVEVAPSSNPNSKLFVPAAVTKNVQAQAPVEVTENIWGQPSASVPGYAWEQPAAAAPEKDSAQPPANVWGQIPETIKLDDDYYELLSRFHQSNQAQDPVGALVTVPKNTPTNDPVSFSINVIDKMSIDILNRMNEIQLEQLIRDIEAHKNATESPYQISSAVKDGPYKLKVDKWLKIVSELKKIRTKDPNAKFYAEEEEIPTIFRPYAKTYVIDIFRLRESQFKDSNVQCRLHKEIERTLDSDSYKKDCVLNAKVNQWIDLLQCNGYTFDTKKIKRLS